MKALAARCPPHAAERRGVRANVVELSPNVIDNGLRRAHFRVDGHDPA
jgi:hypothetical protein